MLWCNEADMWCKNMDDEDKAICFCDGYCRRCEESEEIDEENES